MEQPEAHFDQDSYSSQPTIDVAKMHCPNAPKRPSDQAGHAV